MKRILALLLSWISCLLPAFGQTGTASREEEEIKAAWDRVVEALGGEWKFPVYELLYTESLDLRKPKVRPKGTEQEWTTVEDHEGRRRYMSAAATHDGKGGETHIFYRADGVEEDRSTYAFNSDGVYVSDYGFFKTHRIFNADGWLEEERDLDEFLPATLQYSYEEERLVRIESRDPDETLVEELHYDDHGRLSRIKTHLGDGDEVMKQELTYDDRGRLRSKQRIQEGVILAWDKHDYSAKGDRETITHKWIDRRTGLLGGSDITTKEHDQEGTLRRETNERYGPDGSELKERVERRFDEDGVLSRLETEEAGKSKRVETFEIVWIDG